MNRTVVMTLGFLLLFFGVQLNIVDSYVLTPRMANFLSDQLPSDPVITTPAAAGSGQFTPASYNPYDTAGPQQVAPRERSRVIRPPNWLGWPLIFLGAVFFLNGLAIRR